ncbi:hypothetical protein [uncultured Veillonella sp.]|uniref:hypothetical protein n=1 Tax=uncultured Veillonella sp. TaxID=159268 RepID=UPI0025827CED|nr:hypothetical protein [uncultured Veillonella sp.]
MRKYVSVVIATVLMLCALVLGGCGSLSSTNFEGTWAYVMQPNKKNIDYKYDSDMLYVITMTKKSEHTYESTFRQYKYVKKDIKLLNEEEYAKGDRFFYWLSTIPEKPNSAGVMPKIELDFEFKHLPTDMEAVMMTERDGKLYTDEGTEFTLDSKTGNLISGNQTMAPVENGDLTKFKEEMQQHIKDYFQKKYVDTKKWDITDYVFTDAGDLVVQGDYKK